MSRFACVVFLSAALYAPSVFGQVAPAPVAPRASPDAAQEAAPTSYDGAVLAATRKIVVRDFAGAIAMLRGAATREGSRPEAFCRLGDAQLVQGVLDEARAAYESCARFAGVELSGHPLALALVGLARVSEHENKPEDERAAWQRVAATVKEPAALSLAQARLLVLDALLAQASAQAQVRARIAERAELNAQKPAAKP